MQKSITMLVLCTYLVLANNAYAQHKVSGRVTAETNDVPLAGVTIVEKGTTNGTITDVDGAYSISVKSADASLIFSFISMRTQEVPLNNKTSVNIAMEEDNIGIDEVVVTALGVRRDRKTLGYAISKVSGAELTDAGTTANPIQSLYGKAAGVTIRQSASGPTGGININIRGAAGLESNANTRPLFVVDGVPIFDENTSLSGTSPDYGTGINDINSEDIESIEILKGAKASVLYGSEGANGVVLITTKSGSSAMGEMDVNVSYQTTIEQPIVYIEFQNLYGSGNNIYDVNEIVNGEDYPRANYSIRNFGPAFNADEQRIWWDGTARPYVARPNNFEFMFKNGRSNQISASVSKRSDFGNVRFSYTNSNYDGIMNNFNQKKNILSFSGKFNFSEKLTIETTTNLYNISTHNRPGRSFYDFILNGMARGAPFQEFVESKDYTYTDPEDPNYGYKKKLSEVGYPTGYYSLGNFADYMWSRDNNSAEDDKMHLIATIRPTYHFTDWLYVIGQASLDYTDTDFTTKNSVTRVYPDLEGGYYEFKRKNTRVEEYRGTLNFYKDFMDKRLDIFSFAGGSYKKVSDNSIHVSTASEGASSGFTYPDWYHLNNQSSDGWPEYGKRGKVRGNSYGQNSLYSIFAVATLTLDNLYTLELNARNDWTSTLHPDNNSYFYPGVAFTYDATTVLGNLLPTAHLQFAKLRTSWADVGRDAPSRHYAYYSLETGVVSGSDANTVSAPGSIFDGSLKPERKREFEIGTEMSFFKGNRLGIDFSYYTNNVYDQIMSVPLSSATGASEIKINAGNVKNWGYELQISAVPVLIRNFRWDVTFTTANQFSKVLKLYTGITEKNIGSMTGGIYVKAVEGERIGNLYGHDIKYDPEGRRIVSGNGRSYALNDSEFSKLGNVHPNFMGGFNTSLRYKGLRMTAHFDYSFGASMYSRTNQWLYHNGASVQSLEYRDEAHGGLAYYIDRNGNIEPWNHSVPAPPQSIDGYVYHDGLILPGVIETEDANGNPIYSENDIIVTSRDYYANFAIWTNEKINGVDSQYKNNYIKLREISLSYSLPKSIVDSIKLSDITLNMFARNVGYLYKSVPNLDAEAYMGTNSYFEQSPIPSTRTMGLKVSLGF